MPSTGNNGLDERVERHYTQHTLGQRILDALSAAGKDLNHLTTGDLSGVDEFHIGGRQATIDLAEQLQFAPDQHLLDIGCGIGGASRLFAADAGCRVTGVDITQEYVDLATRLSELVGLGDRVDYQRASALDMPFPENSFDGAYMLHVGMNIGDKAGLFAEAARVLKPGSLLGVYDVMREGTGQLNYPLPWAAEAENNYVEDVAAYRNAADSAGFEMLAERSRGKFAIEFFQRMKERAELAGAAGALNLQLVMGANAAQKVANLIAGLQASVIAPVEMICRLR